MTAFLLQYLPIVIFLGIAAALGVIFILFPWAAALMKLPAAMGQFASWSMMSFLGVLTVGFIYEWKKGALEWE